MPPFNPSLYQQWAVRSNSKLISPTEPDQSIHPSPLNGLPPMGTLVATRDSLSVTAAHGNGSLYSPAKEKAANRSACIARSPPLLLRRALRWMGLVKLRLLLGFCFLSFAVLVASRISSLMGWIPRHPSTFSSLSRGGYTVLIHTWKQNSLLKRTVGHYASCSGTESIRLAWCESDLPSKNLISSLEKIVLSKSEAGHKPKFSFSIDKDNNLINRFKPIENPRTEAVFSVDDDVIVPCLALDFAFSVWKTSPSTMVGFVPRMHWMDKEKNGNAYYKYGGWWSVWWMGTYSMVLAKAAFFHQKYLALFTHNMSASIHDYVRRERNCEDIAMSLLVANASGAPPIWVKGKIDEMGSSGIRSFKGESQSRDNCLNHLISFYGLLPLLSSNFKAVDAEKEWFW